MDVTNAAYAFIGGTVFPVTAANKRILSVTESSQAHIDAQMQVLGTGCSVRARDGSFVGFDSEIYPTTTDLTISPAVNTAGNNHSFITHEGFTDTKGPI